jgi:transposase InsO family protein
MLAEVEALICELRRSHPRWGARRLVFELSGRRVSPVPARATVHRVLVRNGLVLAQEQRHRRKYKRWQRETPMQLWQMDLVGGVFLSDGRECKMLTGIDDHSRFAVIAAVLAVPNGRAVCDAFAAAMRRYGVPSEVLTDNGKQFTGRFTKPRPAEVLLERVCRENGITARLTKPRSPTTTGKVERFHQTLRRELLDHCGPFADLPAAQAAIDAWLHAYNHTRPHQALDMASPASLFRPGRAQPTELDTPTSPSKDQAPAAKTAAPMLVPQSVNAVEFDTVITASGMLNVLPRRQRIKTGAANAGRRAHLWVDEHSVHVLIDGHLERTVPSNLTHGDLHELRLRGAHPAGAPPATPAAVRAGRPLAGGAIEIDRAVDSSGNLTVGAIKLKIGTELARQRVTLRIDGHLVHVITNGTLAKTLPAPAALDYTRLRGVRLATDPVPPPPAGPIRVERRVGKDGVVMVTRQSLRIGRTHAGKQVTIIVEDTHLRVLHNGEELSLHARTSNQLVTRFKPYTPRPKR